jgi:putative transposase
MPSGRPKAPLVLSDEVKQRLETIANSRTLPYAQVRRAQIILMSARGLTNTAISKKVDLSISMVGMWRKRFIEQGLMGLYDQPRPGAPRTIEDDQVAQLIKKTLKKKPQGATHWTCRSIAKETDLSKSTVHEYGKRLTCSHTGKSILPYQLIPTLSKRCAILSVYI